MWIRAEGSDKPVNSGDRSGTCRSFGTARLYIEPCQHTDHSWECTNEAHMMVCEYCEDATISPHTFDYSTLLCTECGYPYNGEVTISFDANGGEGSREPVTGIQLNQEYVLPRNPFIAPDAYEFACWDVDGEQLDPGESFTVHGFVTVKAVWHIIPFGPPDSVLPAHTYRIEAEAFEGIDASAIEIPERCRVIEDHVFRRCLSLRVIRIPKDCFLGEDVFEGCYRVYVYGESTSPAEAYCEEYDNLFFMPEDEE